MSLVFGPLLRTLACLALAAMVHRLAPPPDALRAGLALVTLIGGLWMTQALHLSVTALLLPLMVGVLYLLLRPRRRCRPGRGPRNQLAARLSFGSLRGPLLLLLCFPRLCNSSSTCGRSRVHGVWRTVALPLKQHGL